MKSLIKILLFAVLSIQFAMGWGKTGHRIVGKVAETYLTKNAKFQIKKIMGHHDLSRMSNWADEIKSDPEWKIANDWHWCTIPVQGEINSLNVGAAVSAVAFERLRQIMENDNGVNT